MKNFKLILSTLIVLILFSCSKDSSTTAPLPTSSSGGGGGSSTVTFKGDINYENYDVDNNLLGQGSDQNVQSTLTGTSPDYVLVLTYAGQKAANQIDITVSNNTFQTNVGTGAFEYGVYQGYYDGDSLYYYYLTEYGVDGSTDYTYSGTVDNPGGGGSGGGGSTGITADYTTGTSSFTANGNAYTSSICEGQALNGQIMFEIGDNFTEFSFNADNVSGTGTYDIIHHVYDGDETTHDEITATLTNALTITSVTATSISGTVSFTHSDLTISNCSFTLNQ